MHSLGVHLSEKIMKLIFVEGSFLQVLCLSNCISCLTRNLFSFHFPAFIVILNNPIEVGIKAKSMTCISCPHHIQQTLCLQWLFDRQLIKSKQSLETTTVFWGFVCLVV